MLVSSTYSQSFLALTHVTAFALFMADTFAFIVVTPRGCVVPFCFLGRVGVNLGDFRTSAVSCDS